MAMVSASQRWSVVPAPDAEGSRAEAGRRQSGVVCIPLMARPMTNAAPIRARRYEYGVPPAEPEKKPQGSERSDD